MPETPEFGDRYLRQVRFSPFGKEGQRQLAGARVLLCGCGALGSVIADQLVRAGVGYLRIVDRDVVEISNLHRQTLFTEQDASQEMPKAIAARARLQLVNSLVTVDAQVADLSAVNMPPLAEGMSVLVDGTDNFETRFLINDYAVEQRVPWVFAGCVGAEGQVLAIVPERTPCLRCFLPEPPPASSMPTCETVGVLGPTVGVVAAYQAMETLKLCAGKTEAVNPHLTVFDLWGNQIRSIQMAHARRQDCPACGRRRFDWLHGTRFSRATRLCGRHTVQIAPPVDAAFSLERLSDSLRQIAEVRQNEYFVRLEIEGYQLTVFADGRTLVGGTDSESVARSLHAKYVGS